MRFNQSDSLPKWIELPLMAVFAPFILALVGMFYVAHWLGKGKRALLGPRVGEWQRWFAWHPVTLDGGWGQTVWLETVERQAIGSSYGNGIVYQNVGEPTENRVENTP